MGYEKYPVEWLKEELKTRNVELEVAKDRIRIVMARKREIEAELAKREVVL